MIDKLSLSIMIRQIRQIRKIINYLDKLSYYGIRGTALSLIKKIVTNRVQLVNLNDVKSEYLPINCGVLQGSILGPILFILYINDISNISSIINIILFADDTNIFLAINV